MVSCSNFCAVVIEEGCRKSRMNVLWQSRSRRCREGFCGFVLMNHLGACNLGTSVPEIRKMEGERFAVGGP